MHYTPVEITVEEAMAVIEGVDDEQVKTAMLRFLPDMSGVEREKWVPYLCGKSIAEVRAIAQDLGWGDPPEEDKPFADYVAELVA